MDGGGQPTGRRLGQNGPVGRRRPAAGPPRDAIDRLEGYARNWYGGMVGWMDSRGNGEWAL
ncbi:hypothetical protein GAY28_27835, partial [Azospirillum brasilense]|nr:hypothetical protein [Azospirillum brasilense]